MKLLLGSSGQLGSEFQRSLTLLSEIFACDKNTVDFSDFDELKNLVRDYRPDVIVNAAAYTNVDKAESDTENAEVVYKTTDYYEPEYESYICWNNPQLNIDWDIKGIQILSNKDKKSELIHNSEIFSYLLIL